MKNIAYLEFRRGSLDKARKTLDQVVKIRKHNNSNNNADYVNTLCLIGNIYRIQNHLRKAYDTWKEAYLTIFYHDSSKKMEDMVMSLETLMKRTGKAAENIRIISAFAYDLGLGKEFSSKPRFVKKKKKFTIHGNRLI
mmetsp:Transcript_8530/g.8093  ORF Transcript_8530/g.8093 Transcript_8530/m.8093 type:complete len:138 (-) Transcript_8530:45-458(-)